MIIVYFLRGLVNIFFYLILAGAVVGALAGVVVAVYRTARPRNDDAEARKPRVMRRHPPE